MTVLATITTKNQLTIPKEITEALNLDEIRKVLVSIKGKTMVIKPLSSKVEKLAGSLAYLSSGRSVDFKKIRAITQEKIAQEVAREGI